MKSELDVKRILRDDEFINDYEFGMRIHFSNLIDDLNEFSWKKPIVFSGVF